MELKDHYSILGVSPRDDSATIKAAYRRAVRLCHPDVNTDDPAAEATFRDLAEAYDTLGNLEKRAAYDALLLRTHPRDGRLKTHVVELLEIEAEKIQEQQRLLKARRLELLEAGPLTPEMKANMRDAHRLQTRLRINSHLTRRAARPHRDIKQSFNRVKHKVLASLAITVARHIGNGYVNDSSVLASMVNILSALALAAPKAIIGRHPRQLLKRTQQTTSPRSTLPVPVSTTLKPKQSRKAWAAVATVLLGVIGGAYAANLLPTLPSDTDSDPGQASAPRPAFLPGSEPVRVIAPR